MFTTWAIRPWNFEKHVWTETSKVSKSKKLLIMGPEIVCNGNYFFYNLRGWIRTFIAFFRWPPIFVQGAPNFQNCCFLPKLTPYCALTIWGSQNLSVGARSVCRVLLNTVKICRLYLPAKFLWHAEHWINVKFSFSVYVGNCIQYKR